MPKINKVQRRERVKEIIARQEELLESARERELTAEELKEREALACEVDKIKAEDAEEQMREANKPKLDVNKILRESLIKENKKVELEVREVTPQTTAALADTGIIPVSEQEMLEPIRKGLIWDKVGITIRSGLIGTLRWPKHGKAIASWADEAEEAVDSSIDWSSLTMTGDRLVSAVPVTREELEDARANIVENTINTEMPASIADKINAALMCTTNTYTAADGSTKEHKQYGPFAKIVKGEAKDADGNAIEVTTFAAELPTRKELLSMVGAVSAKIDISNGAWVMTDAMAMSLRDVKVDEGSGKFLNEDGYILGYPVYTTNEIGEGYIGFGDWSYQAAGFFGRTTIIADPYTLARKNSVDFVYNTRFGMTTLRDEAFALGVVTTA